MKRKNPLKFSLPKSQNWWLEQKVVPDNTIASKAEKKLLHVKIKVNFSKKTLTCDYKALIGYQEYPVKFCMKIVSKTI